jgi:hypothetical protein
MHVNIYREGQFIQRKQIATGMFAVSLDNGYNAAVLLAIIWFHNLCSL